MVPMLYPKADCLVIYYSKQARIYNFTSMHNSNIVLAFCAYTDGGASHTSF